MTGDPADATARIDAILAAVADRMGVSVADMAERGPAGDRFRPKVRVARHAAYWVAYRSGGGTLSMARIGRRLDRSWHAVSHGIRVMDALRDADPELRLLTDEMRAGFSAKHENGMGPVQRAQKPLTCGKNPDT